VKITEYLAQRREFFERNLGRFLPPAGSCPSLLRQAMEYSLFAGGKRLRPILTLAAAECCGGSLDRALAPAAAVEMIHTYSLIHDDLPAMDDDDLRRGKPTNHRVFGEGMAILAGDALLTHAFSVLARARELDPDQALAIIEELAVAAGPQGMVAGQALDIQGMERRDPALLKHMHACKTGELLKAAVRIGAISAGADAGTLEALTEYAASLGLAYQIVDDILDVTATSAEMGKNPGSDARMHKQTFVTVYGLEEAEKMAAAETEAAVACLPAGRQEFHILRELALYIGRRRN